MANTIETLESTIGQLRDVLPRVARDAERYRNPTELVTNSRELGIAARALDAVTSDWNHFPGPVIRVKIGQQAIEALSIRKNQYDFRELQHELVEPGEEYDLRFQNRILTDTYNIFDRHYQPIYGQVRYFDLATLGRTLEDGGDLLVSEPQSKD